MKFLVDAQLPPALARWIVAQGHATAHTALKRVEDGQNLIELRANPEEGQGAA